MQKKEFINLVKKIYPSVSDLFFNQIEKYKSFLIEYNQHTNLTRLDQDDKVYGEYFYDSILPYYFLDWKSIKKVLDIGSGSGIPGILLKLLFNDLELTIIEANQKKCLFLKNLIKHLNLENVFIINKRAEKIEKDERESFDLVTSRAVSHLFTISEISIPYAKVNGLIIQPKGINYKEELETSKILLTKMHTHLETIKNIVSPTNKNHYVFVFKKTKTTSINFPRDWKTIITHKI